MLTIAGYKLHLHIFAKDLPGCEGMCSDIIFPFQNNQKNLDSSFKTDLGFWYFFFQTEKSFIATQAIDYPSLNYIFRFFRGGGGRDSSS